MNLQPEAKTAEAALQKASKILLEFFEQREKLERKAKNPGDYATKADLAAEKIIIGTIKKKFPSHDVLAEESGSAGKSSDFRWIIDPLDGTHNFAHGVPLWGTMLAVEHAGELVLSACYLPVLGEMCTAIEGKGTFLNGKRIHVSEERTAKDAMIYYSGMLNYKVPWVNSLALKVFDSFHNDMRVIGSIAAAGVFVASGRMDGIIMAHNTTWDVMPIRLLVEEAGGKVTDLNGGIHSVNSKGCVLSNGLIHDDVIKRIQ